MTQCRKKLSLRVKALPRRKESGVEDREIISLFWHRQESAILETAKKYGRYCHTIAKNILHKDEDAEECVNDAFLRAWETIPPQKPERLSAFLGKITRNIALNRWDYLTAEKRNGKTVPLILDELAECVPGENMEKVAESLDFSTALNRFLASLSKEKRIIFMRRYWYLCSVEEIAKDFHKSESSVKMTLLRLRTAFRTFLEKEGVDL